MMEPKPHKTYAEQLELLKSRGLAVADEADAVALLQRVGYYALSGYSYPFRLKNLDGSRSDRFRQGTSIEQVGSL
ncbi:Abi family protein [Rathayibacter soli]|uniref:Abi family protein n=1 Tax=Rathayibacter soli TaxID=3144168 RepID=UPI0027E5196E|nr:Abi family protein [Glaciibacter superstes]